MRTRYVARTGKINAFRVLVRKPKGKISLKPRRKWENNIKIGLNRYRVSVRVLNLAEVREKWRAAVNTVMNLREMRSC
jgi:hypothetical protein